MSIKNLDGLKKFTDEIRSQAGYKDPIAFAIGRSIKGKSAKTISVNYAVVNSNENYGSAAVLSWAIEKNGIKIDNSGSEFVAPINSAITADALSVFDFLLDECEGHKHRNVQNLLVIDEILNDGEIENDAEFVVTFLYSDEAPKSVEAVYLKLYLLSLNKAEIRSLNLNGAFGLLPNLAWDSDGNPHELDHLRENEIWLKMKGWYPNIVSVDKVVNQFKHGAVLEVIMAGHGASRDEHKAIATGVGICWGKDKTGELIGGWAAEYVEFFDTQIDDEIAQGHAKMWLNKSLKHELEIRGVEQHSDFQMFHNYLNITEQFGYCLTCLGFLNFEHAEPVKV